MIMTAFDTVLLVLHKKRLLQSCDTYKAPPMPLAAEDIFADDQ
jgi:hypothetical protein